MKYEKMIEARRLRQKDGLAIGEISKRLNVSKSSVSGWVKEIKLSPEQETVLLNKNPIYNRQIEGGKVRQRDAQKTRKQYQENGRYKAQQKSWLHTVGCMLYWAEGAKGRNTITFCNSDVNMMKLFIRFLREEMKIQDNDITISINVYLDNGKSIEQIEDFWIDELDLGKNNLRKTFINHKPKSSKGYKKNKHPYGVARIVVSSTEKVQHIFGAIQEYGEFENDKWLG